MSSAPGSSQAAWNRQSQAKSLREQADGTVAITDGPYLKAKEHTGGMSIIDCADMDEALAWGSQATMACRVPVEVRAFFRVRLDKSRVTPGRPVLEVDCGTLIAGLCA